MFEDTALPGTARLHLPGPEKPVWRDRLSQLLESTGEGIFGIDMQGCYTFINRAGAAHSPEHGCPSSTPFARVCPAASTQRCSGARAAAPLRWSIRPAHLVEGAVVTFVDISARRQTEDALRPLTFHTQGVLHESQRHH